LFLGEGRRKKLTGDTPDSGAGTRVKERKNGEKLLRGGEKNSSKGVSVEKEGLAVIW